MIFSFMKKVLERMRGVQNVDKLIKRGLTMGTNVKIMGGVIIDPSHCWHITIGNNVTFAPNVHVLAHDASTKTFLNYTKVANVHIGNDVFVGAGSIILPGVSIGDNVIIGAGSVVSRSIPAYSVAVGNPARVIYDLETYLAKESARMLADNRFDESFTLRSALLTKQQRDKLFDAAKELGTIYIE